MHTTLAGSRDADHDALRALKQSIVAAINQQDVAALLTCFTKEFVFTTIDQRVITDEQGILNYYNEMLHSPDAQIVDMEVALEADDLTHFTDENTGYCVGTSAETYTLKDGKIFRMQARWTATLVKENGEWKAAAVHVGVNILDNPVLAAKSLTVWQKLGIALRFVEPPWEVATRNRPKAK